MNYKHFQTGTLGANGDRKRFGCAVGGAVADCGEKWPSFKSSKERTRVRSCRLSQSKGGEIAVRWFCRPKHVKRTVQRLGDEAERSMSGAFPCHVRNKFPIESIGVKLCPFWEQPGCH